MSSHESDAGTGIVRESKLAKRHAIVMNDQTSMKESTKIYATIFFLKLLKSPEIPY